MAMESLKIGIQDFMHGGQKLAEKLRKFDLVKLEKKDANVLNFLSPDLLAWLCKELAEEDESAEKVSGYQPLRPLKIQELEEKMVRRSLELAAGIHEEVERDIHDVLEQLDATLNNKPERFKDNETEKIARYIDLVLTNFSGIMGEIPKGSPEQDLVTAFAKLKARLVDTSLGFLYPMIEEWRFTLTPPTYQTLATVMQAKWFLEKDMLTPMLISVYKEEKKKKESGDGKSATGEKRNFTSKKRGGFADEDKKDRSGQEEPAPKEAKRTWSKNKPGKGSPTGIQKKPKTEETAGVKDESATKAASSTDRTCFRWRDTGTCQYGDACRYVHSEKTTSGGNMQGGKGKKRSSSYLVATMPDEFPMPLSNMLSYGHITNPDAGKRWTGSLLWDSGSSTTLIPETAARILHLSTTPVAIEILGLQGKPLGLKAVAKFTDTLKVSAGTIDGEGKLTGSQASIVVTQGLVVEDLDGFAIVGRDALWLPINFNVNIAHFARMDTHKHAFDGMPVSQATRMSEPLTLDLETDKEKDVAVAFPVMSPTVPFTSGPEIPRNIELSKDGRLDYAIATIQGEPKSPTWRARARERLAPYADAFTNIDQANIWRIPPVHDLPTNYDALEKLGKYHTPRPMAPHIARYVAVAVAVFCSVGVLVVDYATKAFGHYYAVPKPHGGGTMGDADDWSNAIQALQGAGSDWGPRLAYSCVPLIALPALRLMRGFRPINDVSQLNPHWQKRSPTELTPRDVLFQLSGGGTGRKPSTVFGSIDLAAMFNSIPITVETGRFLGILFDNIPHRYAVLPQGWVNSPFHAQVAMRIIFGDYYSTRVLIKVDDLLLHAEDEEEYLNVLVESVRRLHEHGVQLSLHKLRLANFDFPTVWNGLIVTKDGVRRSRREIDTLQRWLTTPPRNGAELSTLIGQAEYFGLALPGFGTTLRPLRDLLERCVKRSVNHSRKASHLRRIKLDGDCSWNETLQVCLRNIFDAMSNHGELFQVKSGHVVDIYSDASDLGRGWVAVQCPFENRELDFKNRGYTLIGCGQAAWNPAQSKWPTIDQEGYSTLMALREGSHLVYRPEQEPKTRVFSDHANLVKLFDPSYASSKAQRTRITMWTAIMSEFVDFIDIFHLPGSDNTTADYLSRNFGVAQQEKAHLYHSYAEFSLWGDDAGFDLPTVDEIKRASKRSDNVGNGFSFDEDRGIWVNDTGKVHIPIASNLRERIMVSVHCGLGHVGLQNGLNVLSEHVWWETMRKDFASFHHSCIHCLAAASDSEIRRPLGIPVVSKRPGEVWVIDNKELPECQGYIALAVQVDEFSGYTDLTPLVAQDGPCQAAALAQLCSRYGVPRHIIHDGGPSLRNRLMALLSTQLGYSYRVTTANHPQGHGKVENCIRRIHTMLKALCSANQVTAEQWVRFVPHTQLAINTTPTKSLDGHSPFEVFYGRKPDLPLTSVVQGGNGEFMEMKFPRDWDRLVAEAQAEATALWSHIESVHRVERLKRRDRYQAKFQPKPLLAAPGAYVMVLTRGTSKMNHYWRGPARVVVQIDPLHLKVVFLTEPDQLVEVLAARCAFYQDRSLRVTPDLMKFAQFLCPHYDVESIEDLEKREGGLYFLVRWVGYTNATYTDARMLYNDVSEIVVNYLDEVESSSRSTPAKRRLAQLFRQQLGIAKFKT